MLDSPLILAPSTGEVCHSHDGSAPRRSHAASKHSGLAAGSRTQTVSSPRRGSDAACVWEPMTASSGVGEFHRLNRP
jgi:hypothetical protein